VEIVTMTGDGFGGPWPRITTPRPGGWWWSQYFWDGAGISFWTPGFFGPLIEGYDIPDSGGHIGT
jgi:hypothetical protein